MKVRELFSINKDFSRFELIAGERGLERTITDIDVMEVPDGVYWTEVGEFVITTGYFFRDNPEELLKMVEVLDQKKSSGMGIKLGRFIDSLPQVVIDRANELGLPLLNIPVNLGYGGIIWPIVSALLSENSYLEYVLIKFREELDSAMQNKFFLNEIRLIMSNYLDSDVYFLDRDQYNIMKNVPVEEDYLQLKTILGETASFRSEMVTRSIGGRHYRLYEVNHHGIFYGHICLVSKQLQDEKKLLEKRIVSEVAPHIVIHQLSAKTSQKESYESADDLFRELIGGKFEGDEIRLREESKVLNLDYYLGRVVLVVKEAEGVKSVDKKSALGILNQVLAGRGIGVYTFEDNEKLVVVMSVAVMDRENIKKFCQEIVQRGLRDDAAMNLEIGVSKECKSLKHIKAAYEEAEFAQRMGRMLNQARISFYDDYIVYHMMTNLHNHPSVMKLYKNIIVKLRKENGNNEELIDTIKCLVRNNFNITKASDELFLHRNSLYKRINKIQEIIGYDFEQSDTKFILNMVSKLDDLIH